MTDSAWLSPPRCAECGGKLRTPSRDWHYSNCSRGRTQRAADKEWFAALERSNAIEHAVSSRPQGLTG
jgi:hypothetical protein